MGKTPGELGIVAAKAEQEPKLMTREQANNALESMRKAHSGIDPVDFQNKAQDLIRNTGFTTDLRAKDLLDYAGSFRISSPQYSFADEVTIYISWHPHTEFSGFQHYKAEISLNWSGTGRDLAAATSAVANYQTAILIAARLQAITQGKSLIFFHGKTAAE